MFAVIKTGGKQFKVTPGQTLKVEKLPNEAGEVVELNEVAMIGEGDNVRIGAPFMDKAVVKATLVKHFRDDKILVYKKKRRQGYDRLKGHRQDLSLLHIEEILEGGKSLMKAEKKAPKQEVSENSKASDDKKASTKAKAAPKNAGAVKKGAEKKSAASAAPVKKAASKAASEDGLSDKKPASKKAAEKASTEK